MLNRTLVIAEIACSHDGNINTLKKISQSGSLTIIIWNRLINLDHKPLKKIK